MDYFVLEQFENISISAVKTSEAKNAVLYKTCEINKLSRFDYIHKGSLISDRVKQLFERYLPQNKWTMTGYVDIEKGAQEIFWQMNLFKYIPLKDTVFRNDGIIKMISIGDDAPPVIFKVTSPKGVVSDIVHISVAESLLRRKYLRLKLTRIQG